MHAVEEGMRERRSELKIIPGASRGISVDPLSTMRQLKMSRDLLFTKDDENGASSWC